MKENDFEDFINIMENAKEQLNNIRKAINKAIEGKILHPDVDLSLSIVEKQICGSVDVIQKVVDANYGISNLVIKPIRKANLISTTITVVFGIVGMISLIPMALPYIRPEKEVSIKTPSLVPPQSELDNTLYNQKERSMFFGGSQKLDELRKAIAAALPEPTEIQRADVRRIAYESKDEKANGYSDGQKIILKVALGVVENINIIELKDLEALGEPGLNYDKYYLLAARKIRTKDWAGAAKDLANISGDSWLGITTTAQDAVFNIVLNEVTKIPGFFNQSYMQPLLKRRLGTLRVEVVDACGNSEVAEKYVAKLTNMGVSNTNCTIKRFPDHRKWQESQVFYNVSNKIVAETLAGTIFKKKKKAAPMTETQSQNVKKSTSDIVIVLGIDARGWGKNN